MEFKLDRQQSSDQLQNSSMSTTNSSTQLDIAQPYNQDFQTQGLVSANSSSKKQQYNIESEPEDTEALPIAQYSSSFWVILSAYCQIFAKRVRKMPIYKKYFVSGILGNVILFALDHMILFINPFKWQKETVAWALSYIIDIFIQFLLHEILVYGSQSNRCKALIGCYISYATAIILSIIINSFFINQMKYSNNLAWLLTLTITAVVNYFLVNFFMKKENTISKQSNPKNHPNNKLTQNQKIQNDVIKI